MRVVILPELGGRVWELTDLARGRQWVWQRDGVPLRRAMSGQPYDENWAGGWEQLFPNDAAEHVEGRSLPDHGEWWSASWSVEHSDSHRVQLRTETTVRRTVCTKEFRLSGDTVTVDYRIESREGDSFHCLLKEHLAVAISPSCRLRLPGGTVTPVDSTFGTIVGDAPPFRWPALLKGDRTVDLTIVPPRSALAREFIYVSELAGDWCGIDDPDVDAGLRFSFDRAAFPYVWLFLSYGGWNDCYTAVLEPCTNMPKRLTDSVRAGRSLRLDPGQVFETTVSVRLTGSAPA